MSELCQICEENSIFYKDACLECHEKAIIHNTQINKVTNYELYGAILEKEYESNDYIYLEKINTLKQWLSELFKQDAMYNKKIHVKCRCSYVHKRDLKFKHLPHAMYCKYCKHFCSNCKRDVHTDYKGIVPTSKNSTCEQYDKVYQNYNSVFIQQWLAGMNENEREYDKVKNLIINEQLSLKLLTTQDLRLCPYTDYKSARKFERSYKKYDYSSYSELEYGLTSQYNEDNWHEVACNSDPVSKTDCDDMYCSRHNPEKISTMVRYGKKVGTNNKGCGRRIDWKYWIKVKPTVDEKIYGNHVIKQSDIVKCTMSHNVQKEYLCDICNNYRTCMSATCTYSQCSNRKKTICGICVANRQEVLKEKAELNTTLITILHGNITFNFTKENGKYRGNIYFTKNSNDHCDAYLEWSSARGRWEIRSVESENYITYGYFSDLIKDFEKYPDRNRNDIRFHWSAQKSSARRQRNHDYYDYDYNYNNYNYNHYNSRSAYAYVIIETHIDDTYKKLQNHECIKDKHVMYFNNIDSFKERFNNFDQWTKEYNAVEIIIKSIKKYQFNKKRLHASIKINKLIKLYMFNSKRDDAATTLNLAFYYHLIRKRWVKLLEQMKTLITLEPMISVFLGRKYIYCIDNYR